MTISTSLRSQQFTGDSVSTVFTFGFYFIDNSHISVYRRNIGATAWNLQTYGSHYSLTGAGVQSPVGGTVTMVIVPSSSEEILVVRNVPYTQGNNLVDNDDFDAEAMERSLDLLTMGEQQLDARLSSIEALVPAAVVPSEPFIFSNNAIICLKNTITQDASIPSGFNALAIQPTISVGKTVNVPVGSIFVTLDNSLGTGGTGPYAALTTNVFTGRQDFGTPSGSYINRIDPTYGDHYILKNAATSLPVNTSTGEFNGFAADLREQTGTDSLVPLHGAAISKLTHNGVTTGVFAGATNDTDKTAAGLGAQLFGATVYVANQVFSHTAAVGAGLYLEFRNRTPALATTTPTNGAPGAGQGYNKGFAAIYINSYIRGTATGIPCGWQTGIMFDKQGLDRITGGALAVGIDFTALSLFGGNAPEGTPYGSRVAACIAFPTGWNGSAQLPAMTFDDAKTCSILFSNVGTLEVRQNTSMRFAVQAPMASCIVRTPPVRVRTIRNFSTWSGQPIT
jgi:hypothetical protein